MLSDINNFNQRIQRIREAKRRSLSDCAAVLGITTEEYAEIEKGTIAPSLPQIELLAKFFDISSKLIILESAPIGDKQRSILDDDNPSRFMDLRNKMIYARLRIAQQNLQINIQDIHQATQIPIDQLEAYEKSKTPIPIDHLWKMTSLLEVPLDEILAQVSLGDEVEYKPYQKAEWEPAYPEQEVEIIPDETDPDQVFIDAMHQIPKEAQAKIAKILVTNLKKDKRE